MAVGEVPGRVINKLGLIIGVRGQEKEKAGHTAECVSPGRSVSQMPLIQL